MPPRTLRYLPDLGLAALAAATAAPGPRAEAQTKAPAAATTPAVAVVDAAKMFSADAAVDASSKLADLERTSHTSVRIETVDTLGGKDSAAEAVERAKKAGAPDLYVLIAKTDRHIQLEPGQSARSVFTKAEEQTIIKAFTAAFAARDNDKGLRDAVAEIARAASAAPTPKPAPASSSSIAGVRDGAKVFGTEAVGRADEALKRLSAKSGKQVVIETITSLDGKPIKETALAKGRALKLRGLYMLIALNDHKVYVAPTTSAASMFTPDRVREINAAVIAAFKTRSFDKGLDDAVALIMKDAEASPSPSPPTDHNKHKPTGAGLSAGLPDDSGGRPSIPRSRRPTPAPPSPGPGPGV